MVWFPNRDDALLFGAEELGWLPKIPLEELLVAAWLPKRPPAVVVVGLSKPKPVKELPYDKSETKNILIVDN